MKNPTPVFTFAIAVMVILVFSVVNAFASNGPYAVSSNFDDGYLVYIVNPTNDYLTCDLIAQSKRDYDRSVSLQPNSQMDYSFFFYVEPRLFCF